MEINSVSFHSIIRKKGVENILPINDHFTPKKKEGMMSLIDNRFFVINYTGLIADNFLDQYDYISKVEEKTLTIDLTKLKSANWTIKSFFLPFHEKTFFGWTKDYRWGIVSDEIVPKVKFVPYPIPDSVIQAYRPPGPLLDSP